MATQLDYLNDFDITTGSAQVTRLHHDEQGRQVIELNTTCFYPRGGGQDWDTGFIKSGDAEFRVDEVRLGEDGVVAHIGEYTHGTFKDGTTVECEVNDKRRRINTKLHSAGHLIDMAVDQLGLGWIATRGGHYPHMCFVEYDAPGFEVNENLSEQLQAKVNELSQSSYENKILFVPVEEMANYCRHVPANIPTNKPSRVVLYSDNFGIPCGGTHVAKVSDIGEIEITKIKAKKGIIKVSYRVEGIN